jgi:hypothetical protein
VHASYYLLENRRTTRSNSEVVAQRAPEVLDQVLGRLEAHGHAHQAVGDPQAPMYGPPEEGQGPGDNPALVQAAGEMTAAVLRGEPSPARNATARRGRDPEGRAAREVLARRKSAR